VVLDPTERRGFPSCPFDVEKGKDVTKGNWGGSSGGESLITFVSKKRLKGRTEMTLDSGKLPPKPEAKLTNQSAKKRIPSEREKPGGRSVGHGGAKLEIGETRIGRMPEKEEPLERPYKG